MLNQDIRYESCNELGIIDYKCIIPNALLPKDRQVFTKRFLSVLTAFRLFPFYA